jgi:F0F1-type ATP synthase assembly protein I
MKRSIFFIITSIISALFGGMMFFLPDMVTEGFGSTPTTFSSFLMRETGLIMLGLGVLNFLVRNDSDSMALKAIFIFNIVYHVTMIPIVFIGVSQGVFTIDKSIGGLVAHLFIGIGSVFYLMKIKTPVR